MNAERLRVVLDLLRWTQRGLAEALSCDDRLVRRWAAGQSEVAPAVADWLERLAEAHDRNPPPVGWQRRPGV